MEALTLPPRPRVVLVDNDGPEVGKHILDDVADVFCFSDPLKAEAAIPSIKPDHVVTDLLMPELSGDELIRRLVEQGVDCSFTVRSGFFDAAEVADFSFLGRFGGDLSDKHRVGSKAFFESLRARFSGDQKSIKKAFPLALDPDHPPQQRSVLEFRFDEFRKLSQEDRYSFVERAQRLLESEISEAFASGAVWYLFGGQSRQPLTAENSAEIPSRAEINDWCRTRNIPVIQCFRGVTIDDIVLGWSGSCADSMRDYPLLGVSGTGNSKDMIPVHFDTGSPVSFADFDVLSNLTSGLEARDTIDFTPFIVNGETIKVAHERVALWLVDPDGNSPVVTVSLVVPKDWNDLSVRRRLCSASCKRGSDEKVPELLRNYGQHDRGQVQAHYCWYRWGLIGRSFLLESKLSLILDGRDRLIRLHGEHKNVS